MSWETSIIIALLLWLPVGVVGVVVGIGLGKFIKWGMGN